MVPCHGNHELDLKGRAFRRAAGRLCNPVPHGPGAHAELPRGRSASARLKPRPFKTQAEANGVRLVGGWSLEAYPTCLVWRRSRSFAKSANEWGTPANYSLGLRDGLKGRAFRRAAGWLCIPVPHGPGARAEPPCGEQIGFGAAEAAPLQSGGEKRKLTRIPGNERLAAHPVPALTRIPLIRKKRE